MKRRALARDDARSRARHDRFDDERHLDPIAPLTDRQAEYLSALATSDQVIVLGPAGTGKTYCAGSFAADLLRKRVVSKILITRPNVPSGRSLGFFPGTLEEKLAPWVAPLTNVIRDRIGQGAYDTAVKSGAIEVLPFETMRGATFKDCFVILDEAQNTTVHEMKMFLTRVGEGARVVVNGDVSQSDLRESSGLRAAIHLAKSHMLPVSIVEFGLDDIVRSDLCALWTRAFHENGL